jgi:hypothetical protein
MFEAIVEKTKMSTLPEDCIQQICFQLVKNIAALHSCILVNRRWCCTTISFLWRAPFQKKFNETALKKIIDIYIGLLSSERKLQLNIDCSCQSNSYVFYYPSFLRVVDTVVIKKAINIWVEETNVNPNQLLHEIGQLIVKDSKQLTEIRFGPEKVGDYQLSLFENPISENARWFQLRKVKFRGPFRNQDLFLIVAKVAIYLEKISIIYILDSLNSECLGKLVSNQRNLTSLKFCSLNSGILEFFFRGFVGKENLTFSVFTLKYLEFSNVDFIRVPLLIFLNHFPNLESLNLSFCKNVAREINYSPTLHNICRKLLSFEISYTDLNSRDVCDILQNSGKLQRFHLPCRSCNNIPTISKYLAKRSSELRELTLNELFLPHMSKYLKAFQQLQDLSIVSHFSIFTETQMNGEDLMTFGASIPDNLRQLNILSNWKFLPVDFKNFLKQCTARLDCLYLGFSNSIGDDHVEVLEEYLCGIDNSSTKYYLPSSNISQAETRKDNGFYCNVVPGSIELRECGKRKIKDNI